MSPLPSGVMVGLDTSGPVGSVAVARDGVVLSRTFLTSERGHAAAVVPALDRSLSEAGASRSDIGGVVVGSGPGSFTGVRVAAATAKGLSHALGVPLWAVSSLEAAAVSDRVLPPGVGPWDTPSGPVLDSDAGWSVRFILFDARGDRVYAAGYRVHPHGIEVAYPPRAGRLGEILAKHAAHPIHFAGTGAMRHRERIVDDGHRVLPFPVGVPTADGLIHLVSSVPVRAAVEDPRGWEPDYLRSSSAERAGDP